ncbi:ABC-three component system middle component 1 [Paraburkholderia sediminicola]|uniref:ABC-three component system middle component 1 n=1 Tax=Paraburkholderia sediminicola TaxID=458836 RepID=UPI0038B87714
MLEEFKQKIISVATALGLNGIYECYGSYFIAVDFCIVAIGSLAEGSTREQALSEVDSMLAAVLEIRKRCSPAKASDIYLMLVCPVGSIDSPFWKELAAEIERDDRLARKHVWLPCADSGNFEVFVANTFLAKPWDSPSGTVDALKLMADDLDMPKGWQEVLLNTELETVELINKLLLLDKESI